MDTDSSAVTKKGRRTLTSCEAEAYLSRKQQKKAQRFNKFLSSVNDRYQDLQKTPQEKPKVVRKYEPRLSGWAPSPRWKTHNKQKDALNLVKVEDKRLIAVAYERDQFGREGQRRFITSSPEELFFYYFQMPQSNRNHYEVICEGKPCKLYFDIEFSFLLNPLKRGPEMVYTFIQLVSAFAKSLEYTEPQMADILNLDSSSEEKFSRHLVFTKTVFSNNGHAGAFVRSLCDQINCAIETAELSAEFVDLFGMTFKLNDLRELYVYTTDSNNDVAIFVDHAVYSKNRNFRMYKSSKLGKMKFLNRAESCEYEAFVTDSDLLFKKQLKPGYQDLVDINPELYRTFLDSLITNIDFEADEILSFETEVPKSVSFRAFPKLGEAKLDVNELGLFIYPELESFILGLLRKRLADLGMEDCSPFFRTCKGLTSANLIVYELGHSYRYCERIGRFHKSNKVYICVDVEKCVFYQKCFDPDCEGFRGNEFPFSPDLIPWKGFESELIDDWN